MKHTRIFIITGRETTCCAWSSFLSRRGWDVLLCRSCDEFYNAADACLLSLVMVEESMAADMSPAAVKKNDIATPVLMFAKAGTLPNKKIAEYLQNGYDDFIQSDIDPRVLEAKLLVSLRWALPVSARAMEEVRSRSGLIKVNKAKHVVSIKRHDGFYEVSGLTQTELSILAMLVGREGNVVGREFILDSVWRGKVVNLENVDKHIEALRAKLSCFGKNIETVYGLGYCYRENK